MTYAHFSWCVCGLMPARRECSVCFIVCKRLPIPVCISGPPIAWSCVMTDIGERFKSKQHHDQRRSASLHRRRWGPVVKITYWSIAAAVLANAVSSKERSGPHIWMGYGLAAIPGLLGGLIGPDNGNRAVICRLCHPSACSNRLHAPAETAREITRHRRSLRNATGSPCEALCRR